MTAKTFKNEKRKKRKKEKKLEGSRKKQAKQKQAKRLSKKQRRKSASLLRTLLFVLFFAVFVVGLCSLLWYLSFASLNPEDYLSVTYSGYDGKGTAVLSFREAEAYNAFLDEVEIQLLSPNGELKNGDFLEIHFLYDKEESRLQGLRLPSDTCQVKVSGLPEGIPFSAQDAFAPLQITYDGIAPELSILLENESTEDFLKDITYEIIDAQSCYDIGDTFTVRASFSEEAAIRYQYQLTEAAADYTETFTVAETDRYIREASQLSADQLSTLNQAAASLFGDAAEYGLRIFSEANLMPIWVNGKTTFVWSNPRLLSAYLNVLKPEYFDTAQSHNNDVKLVYLATLSQADGVACEAEVVIQFTNLVCRADGSYDLSLDSGKIIAASYNDSHIKALVTDTYHGEYEEEKLELSNE